MTKYSISSDIPDRLEIFLDENGEPTDGFLQALKVYEVDDEQGVTSLEKNASSSKAQTFQPPTPLRYNRSFNCECSASRSSISDTSTLFSDDEEEFAAYNSHNKPTSSYDHPSALQGSRRSGVKVHLRKHASASPNTKRKTKNKKIKKSRKDTSATTAPTSSAELIALGIDPSSSDIQTSVAQETIASLKLRITGQLKTIRSLESQLSAASQVLQTKDQQLLETRKSLLQQERLRNSTSAERRKSDVGSKHATDATTTALISQLRSDLSDALKREHEEISKRRRADERFQHMKQYCDKQKQHLAASETKVSELTMQVSQLEARIVQMRIRAKDLEKRVSDGSVSMELAMDQRDVLKQRADKAESSHKEAKKELSQAHNDLAALRHQLQASHERERRLTMEIELLRERDATHRLHVRNSNSTGKVAATSSRKSPPSAPDSPEDRVGIGAPRRQADNRDKNAASVSSVLRTPEAGAQYSRLERMYERVTASGGSRRR